MQVKSVQVGWKSLEAVLNQLIDAINANAPVEGNGILLETGPAGTMISVTATNAAGGGAGGARQPWLSTPTGEAASWQLVQVMVSDTVYDKWVWGGSNFNPRPCATASS